MQATRIYRPDTVSIASWRVEGRTQEELWQWWIWAGQMGSADTYQDGLSLADKLPLHRAMRARTAILSASKRRGHIVLTATL